jgi:hypothetical protein
MDTIAGLIAKAPDYLIAISTVVTGLTAITMITPTQIDNKWLGKATGVINFLLKICNMGAGNILKNKNKDENR